MQTETLTPATEASEIPKEFFGPILPAVPVADVDEAIRFVNERDRPLALYVFAESDAVQERVLEQTSSRGACVNATVMHVAVPDLPDGCWVRALSICS